MKLDIAGNTNSTFPISSKTYITYFNGPSSQIGNNQKSARTIQKPYINFLTRIKAALPDCISILNTMEPDKHLPQADCGTDVANPVMRIQSSRQTRLHNNPNPRKKSCAALLRRTRPFSRTKVRTRTATSWPRTYVKMKSARRPRSNNAIGRRRISSTEP